MHKQDIEDVQQILYWFYRAVNNKEINLPDMDNARILELKQKLNEIHVYPEKDPENWATLPQSV